MLIATQIGTDKLTLINWIGFIVCIFGIAVHINNKYQINIEKAQTDEMSSLIANEILQESEDELPTPHNLLTTNTNSSQSTL